MNGRRFTLVYRSLLIVVTLFCVISGYCVYRHRSQRNAAAHFATLGGTVCYDYQDISQYPSGTKSTAAIEPKPASQSISPFREYFANVDMLLLSGSNVKDLDMVYLGNFPGLRVLSLANTSIDSQGLAYLKSLPELENLDLSGTLVTDSDLGVIGQLQNLRELDLTSTSVTNDGVEILRRLDHLKVLSLMHTRVSVERIELLRQQMPNTEIY